MIESHRFGTDHSATLLTEKHYIYLNVSVFLSPSLSLCLPPSSFSLYHCASLHLSFLPPYVFLTLSLRTLVSTILSLPQLSSALMFDAVHVVVGAVRELNRSQEIGVKPLSCTTPQIWQHGTSLMNYLRMVPTPALSLLNTVPMLSQLSLCNVVVSFVDYRNL